MTWSWLFVLLAMFAVTYSVRLLPFLSPKIRDLPPSWREFLKYVPPAALGALVIPDVFVSVSLPAYSTGATVSITIAGLILAAVVAVKTRQIVGPVVVSVVVLYGVILIGG